MSFKYRILHRLYGRAQAYRWIARRDPALRRLMPSPTTEICIEGFPRSGNTFAVIAFEKAQGRPVRISHHLHAEGQIAWAIRHGIPTIVLLRHPLDAIASLLLRDHDYDDGLALARYLRFHRALLDWRDRLVFSKFESTVGGMNEPIAEVNRRFGTSFRGPNAAGIDSEVVFDAIDRLNADNEKGAVNQIARPDEGKSGDLSVIKARLMRNPRMAQAVDIWRDLETSAL
jgi:hypothetical protein